MSSYDVLRSIESAFRDLPMFVVDAPVSIIDAGSGCHQFHRLSTLRTSAGELPASTIAQAFSATMNLQMRCSLAIATGEGFQGPVAIDDNGGLWAVQDAIGDADSWRFPASLVCVKLADSQ